MLPTREPVSLWVRLLHLWVSGLLGASSSHSLSALGVPHEDWGMGVASSAHAGALPSAHPPGVRLFNVLMHQPAGALLPGFSQKRQKGRNGCF